MIENKADASLLSDLKVLVAKERRILADVISHLEEVNKRKLYVELGYKSLLKYCVGELKYSESAAYRRIKTIKLIKAIPEIKKDIKHGMINLSQSTLAQTLFDGRKVSEAEKKTIMKEVRGKSKRRSEEIIRERLRLPQVKQFISVEVGQKTINKWNELKARVAHMDLNEEALLNRLIDTEMNLVKLSTVNVSGKKSNSLIQRYVSKSLRKEVFKRADYKCQRCCSVYSLEVEHIKPIGVGGKSEINNLILLCKACNTRGAIKTYGLDKMKKYL